MTEFDPFARHVFYDNEFHASQSSDSIEVIDPATEEPVGEVADCSADEVESVIDRATDAQTAWERLDAKTRASFLHDVAGSIESSGFDDAAELMTKEHGKPFPEAEGELANVAPVFRYYAEMARDEAGRIPGSTQSESFQFYRYFPYGVTVHIVPSNFPRSGERGDRQTLGTDAAFDTPVHGTLPGTPERTRVLSHGAG